MLRMTVWLCVGVFLWGFASCSIRCPDGSSCSNMETCCQTVHGYSCCPYPKVRHILLNTETFKSLVWWCSSRLKKNLCRWFSVLAFVWVKAVCCSDLAHCCPSGYSCDLATQTCVKQYQPWITIPIVRKVAAEVSSTPDLSLTPFEEVKQNNSPEQLKSSGVYCDSYTMCPDGTTCCKHPKSGWSCCPFSPVSRPANWWAINHFLGEIPFFFFFSIQFLKACFAVLELISTYVVFVL